MGELRNFKHETFARAVAAGRNLSQAYADSGYRPCRQSASRLLTRADVRQRVDELKTQRQTDTTNDKDKTTGRFLPGNSGFSGRPKGSRNKLAEKFISDLHDEWEVSGAAALKRVAAMDPVQFVKITASILPAKIDATLSIDTDFLKDVMEFSQAWQLARQFIGADDHQMIELQPIVPETP